ncbi:MAG: tRNA pseudouridine(38-40) synthase TruA [Bacteroidales bacterium]|nr:tRNA pseudouridine(38-40) synthase TruA [Bacteroidales bacterium]
MKKRYFIELAFKGTAYHGWQKQPNASTVQDIVNHALSVVLKETIETVGAGRTDTGVHARYFAAHFESDLYDPVKKHKLLYGINSILPIDIAVNDIYRVTNDAHARFSALSRTYEYRISRSKDPFETDFSWYYPHNLDIQRMNKAAEVLLKIEDFKSFSKYHSQVKTSICKLSQAAWTENNNTITFTITADRFLRNMVRAIVGTLVEAGRGKISLERLTQIVLAANRKETARSAPAKGLFLTRIMYPSTIKL